MFDAVQSNNIRWKLLDMVHEEIQVRMFNTVRMVTSLTLIFVEGFTLEFSVYYCLSY